VSRVLDVLMFKLNPMDGPPFFVVVSETSVATFKQWGWRPLVTEREVRYADVDEVRREDERGSR
jgi:hypothetical protein